MEPVIAILGAGAAIAVLVGVQRRRARIDACRQAMDACGVVPAPARRGLGIPILLQGTAGALTVTMEPYERGIDARGFRIAVSGLPGMTLRRETMGIERQEGAREIVLGDAAFDDAVYAEGAAVATVAVLDAATRARVLRLVTGALDVPGEAAIDCKAGVFNGHLRVDVLEEALGHLQRRLDAALRETLALAVHLAPLRGADDLARNAEHDPVVGVRVTNLRLLAREFPEEERTRTVLRACSAGGPEPLRLAAALLMGPEGHEALLDLALHARDEGRSVEAIRALGAALPAEQATALLASALAERRYRAAHACLQRLEAGVGSTAVLLDALRAPDGPVAGAAARALGRGGDPAAEAPLLETLDHPHDEARVAAAVALGRMATVRAVLPLKTVEARADVPAALRRAARQAVAEIQSRLGPAAPGQLTVVADAGGAVSITAAGGEVSLDPNR